MFDDSKAPRKRPENHKVCAYCSEPYVTSSNNSTYCSKQCRGKVQYQRRKEYNTAYNKRRAAEAGGYRSVNLQIKYGINEQEWEALFDAQGRKCYFGCETTGNRNWVTDHDHETGEVRKILCNKHNMAIGWIENHMHELADLLLYIESHKIKGNINV